MRDTIGLPGLPANLTIGVPLSGLGRALPVGRRWAWLSAPFAQGSARLQQS